MKILIAEDSPINRQVLEIVIKRLGHEVAYAENGRIAVEMFKTNNYPFIFMDENMPEMDGIEATNCIRKISANPEKPYIVALTASDMKVTPKNFQDLGMNEFISKPILVEEISNVIHRYTTQ